ncbi:hypothetical protein ABID69_002887 [Stenotrophomonas sp. PvP087]|nr:hypothetical protein FB552_3989 [Stenotrophomonas maltophilia]VEF36834.1 Uncharacterised protein [Stenotrophomonas maltophilia]
MTTPAPQAPKHACFTTTASLRPGHHVIVPCGQERYPVPPPLPNAAQENTP